MQTPRRRGSVASLQEALRGFLKENGLSLKLRDGEVFRAFNDALGPALAQRARPVRFERGELAVEVQSSAHLQELSTFTGEGFRAQANRQLGGERILRVTFHLKR